MTKYDPWSKGQKTSVGTRHFRPKALTVVSSKTYVEYWWRECVKRGCQLINIDEYCHGYDYKGDAKWKTMVAVEALFTDFMEYSKCPSMIKTQFYRLLREITGTRLKITNRYGTLRNEDGKVAVRPSRRYMRFDEFPVYVET